MEMKKAIVWDKEALYQLKEAYYYLKEKSPKAAKKVRNTLLEEVRKLTLNPEVYELDQLKTKNDGSYRAFVRYHFRVAYQVKTTQIRILRIRHTSREPDQY